MINLHFFEGEGRSLREQLEHLEEKLTEVELATPLRIIVAGSPMCNEVVLDPIVLLNVVEKLDNLRVFGLIQVDVGRHDRILRR